MENQETSHLNGTHHTEGSKNGHDSGYESSANSENVIREQGLSDETPIENHTEVHTEVETVPDILTDPSRKADLKQQLEALVFASDEALPNKSIRHALDVQLSDEQIQLLIDEINDEFESTNRVFRIRKIAGGYRYLTEKQFHKTIQKLIQPKLQRRLTQAALESLAIIAYKQPLSKSEIENIRGVNADYVIRILMERNLIEVCGRSEAVGKPLLYGTTKEFLDYFNLHSLADLPKPREIDELLREGDAQEFLKQELNARLKVELEKDDAQEETESAEAGQQSLATEEPK